MESPNKIKKLKHYLGDDYIIKASVGHIRDLSTKDSLGIDIDNNFKPHYVINKDKYQVVEDIINAADECSKILLATDPDREGEAISFHLQSLLATSGKVIKRITFNEITEKAVLNAIANEREIDMDLFRAQEARRMLDRIVGFMVSPYLMRKYNEKLSAGRVQSVAVRMISDRENEIKSFKPEEFFNIEVNLSKDNEKFIAKLDNRYTDKSKAEADKQTILKINDFTVDNVVAKAVKENPQPPLTTSKLQQVMAKLHNFDADRTMKAAQTLYEGGYCTYIRTDSVRANPDAIQSARDWLNSNNYKTPSKAVEYSAKDSAADAHECIRPSDVNVLSKDLTLSDDEIKTYETIWRYFIASQMLPAVYNTLALKIKLNGSNLVFKANGKALKEKNYLEIFKSEKNVDKIDIPLLNKNDKLKLTNPQHGVILERKETKPPSRLNEAVLIEELEKRKIGRPATYAAIIKNINDRKYVEKRSNIYYPTPLGAKICEDLKQFFNFLNYDYTASMEDKLDQVAEGKTNQTTMLREFFDPFKQQLNKAYENNGAVICEQCKSPMIVRKRKSDNVEFLGCSNFPKCKNIKSR